MFGLVGFVSTLLLGSNALLENDTYDVFAILTFIANPILGLTGFFAWKRHPILTPIFSTTAIYLGCIGALFIPFEESLVLVMIFVLSAIFVTIGKKSLIAAYSAIVGSLFIKVLIEASIIETTVIAKSHLNDTSLTNISILLVSVFAYGFIINLMVQRGMKNSQKLIDTKDELQRTMELKKQIMTVVSHDLRAPVTNMHSILEMMQNQGMEPDKEDINLLYKTSESANALLNDLLLWYNLDNIEDIIQKKDFDIEQCIIDTTSIFKTNLERKRIHLNLTDLSKHSIHADKRMIESVIRNLISNAIKFSNDGGQIAIQTEVLSDELLKVKVVDQGIGMTKEKSSQLLDSSKGNTPTQGTSKEMGTGLGLRLTQDFVHANNGHIGVKSVPNQGSTFWFTVPLAS